jgi:hypothetical protein
MSTDLVHVDQTSHTFDLIAPASALAEQIARTDFVPDGLKGNPPAVMAAMLKGHEVGMAPMQALSHIHVIKGRPTISAEGQRALVLAAGHSIRVKKLSPEVCTLVGIRAGESEGTEVSYTLAEAKKAGIARGNNWQNHPTDMLLARASTRLCRAVFPDVTGGLASAEEVIDLDETDVGDAPGTVKRKAPAPKKAAARAKAEPKAEPTEPAADLPPLPHELDDQVVDAEVIDDDEPTEPAITEAQTKKLLVEFKRIGLDDRDERLEYCRDKTGRDDLTTSKQLTKAEATALIDELVAIP